MEDNRSKYLRKMHTPTPFSQGPEMKNYSRMMELQSQAPNFTRNDPRFDELKAARRKYNREDKYKIGERFNVAPLDVQKDFSDRTEFLFKSKSFAPLFAKVVAVTKPIPLVVPVINIVFPKRDGIFFISE